jgi:putative ATP-binding cassette transporter
VWWIGKPLVGLNFNQERFEANFRFGLIRVREHAEAVALYRGEVQEKMQLQARMDDIRDNWWNIMRVTKKLNIGVNFYGQAANIFPLLVSAPRYFSGAITLGVLMQISNAFGQVQDALSWFINSFTTLASWKASINRLAGFNADVQRMQNLPTNIRVRVQKPVHHQSPDAAAQQGLQIEHLNLNLPDGRALLKDFNARIERGQHILISGPSGCGKSTLVRAIADIWPYGEGRIALPADAGVMFLPQRSYLPIGTLRAALSYPAAEGAFSDEQIASCLELCRLPHLQQAIGETANWSQHLSPGEQQRLAFVRVFLNRPDILFLDEASSAMDGETEEALYTLLPQQLPGVTVVSIAHRETLARFHRQRWHFSRNSGASALRDEEGFRVEVSGLQAGPV